MILRQAEGTGLGSGITTFDGRPIERMALGQPPEPAPHAAVLDAMIATQDVSLERRSSEVIARMRKSKKKAKAKRRR
jgi:hypothetical protein